MERDTLSKDLRMEILKAGIKNIEVRRGRGTAFDWVDINPRIDEKKGYRGEWNEREQKILESEFGLRGRSGHSVKRHEAEAFLYGHRNKALKQSPQFQKVKQEFFEQQAIAMANNLDGGTVVGGAGLIVKKNGKPIDFWRNKGMSENPSIHAQRIVEKKLISMGLDVEHESGWMD